jgi:hypothetical protein
VIIFIDSTPPAELFLLEIARHSGIDSAVSNGYAMRSDGMKINVLRGKSHGVF